MNSNCNVRYYTSWLEPSWMTGETVVHSVEDLSPNHREQENMLTNIQSVVESRALQGDGESFDSDVYGRFLDYNKWVKSEKSSKNGVVVGTGKYVYRICMYIQMELCTSTTLSDWLRNRSFDVLDTADVEQASGIFRQIVDGLNHVHSKNIIHRDLKPANVFLSKTGIWKIGDMGLSKLLVNNTNEEEVEFAPLNFESEKYPHEEHTVGVGTTSYASPEQIQGSDYGPESDVYSLGLMLMELFSAFDTEHERQLAFRNCRNGFVPDSIKLEVPDVYELILQCTHHEPSERPTAKEILSSSLFIHREKLDKESFCDQYKEKKIRKLQEEIEKKDKIIDYQQRIIEKLQKQLSRTKQSTVQHDQL